MSSPSEPTPSAEHELHEVIAAYLQSVDAGRPLDRQELLRRHPHLAEALQAFFADHDRMKQAAAPLPPGQVPTLGLEEVPAAPAPLDTVAYFGDYQLLAEIARGGMGVVYRARQVSLNRPVALKMILAGQLASPQDVQRFQSEAEAAANLDHPNIVPIYEIGQHNGLHYFSMKLIEGRSLAQEHEQWSGDSRAAARLLATAARAVHHAHQHGILHRDLKPANVLLDEQRQPHLTDFGLARRVDGGSNLTQSGAIVGTPGYMAPEQARGERGLTTGVDVYGLGAILYELLTGRPPFQADNPLDTLLLLLERDPEPPRRLNPRLDRDLETICLKCLHKEPGKRYASAEDLAEDLERWLAGEPISARRISPWRRLLKWARRRPAAAALVLVSALALVIFNVGGGWFTAQLKHERDEIQLQRDEADRQRGLAQQREVLARRRLYASRAVVAAITWRDGETVRLLDLLELQRPGPDEEDLRGFEWHYLWRLCHDELLTYRGHRSAVSCVRFSPDGRLVASAGWEGGGQEGVLEIWQAADGKKVASLVGQKGEAHSLAFSPDGRRLATGNADGVVRVWEVPGGRLLQTLRGHRQEVVAVSLDPDGKQVLGLGADAWLRRWDPATGKETHAVRLAGLEVVMPLGLAFSPDGDALAVGLSSGQNTVAVWNATTGKKTATFRGHTSPVSSAAFSPDGRTVASGSGVAIFGMDGDIKLWDLKTGKERLTLRGHKGEVFGLAFSPDGERLVSGSADGAVKVWDVSTGQETFTFRGHTGSVTSVAFAPDGRRAASAGTDQAAKLWDAANGPGAPLGVPRRNLLAWSTALAYRVGDGHLLSVGSDIGLTGLISSKLRDVTTGTTIHSWKTPLQTAEGLAFSPDGARLALVEDGPVVKVWDTATGREVLKLEGLTGKPDRVLFSPDGSRLAASAERALPAGTSATVCVWDARTGRLLRTFEEMPAAATALAFGPDGTQLVTGHRDRQLRGWDLATGQEVWTVQEPTWVRAIVFRPNGEHIITAAGDVGSPGVVKVRDAATGEEQLSLQGHSDVVTCLALSPDGKRIVSAGADKTVKVWDAVTGQELLTLRGHFMLITQVLFRADGLQLASLSAEGAMHLWDATPRR
jgi:WD40 repeat protein/predicted Ser/Thr protein kinase